MFTSSVWVDVSTKVVTKEHGDFTLSLGELIISPFVHINFCFLAIKISIARLLP